MPVAGADWEWLVDRVDGLMDSVARMTIDEIRSSSRSVLESRRGGEEPPDLIAGALALVREALRRIVGVLPDAATVAAALQVIAGSGRPPVSRGDSRSAAVMALYWHSLAGQGVHFVGLDDAAARAGRDFFGPVGALLGCKAGLVTSSTGRGERPTAYGAGVTFGSWEELAEDYLRDTLQPSLPDVVQPQLCVAVVDDTEAVFAAKAGAYRLISGPRVDFDPPGLDILTIARSFRERRDYRVDHAQAEIWLTRAAMSRLKAAVGWGAVPSLEAVTAAERVEATIARREGIGKADLQQTIAEISLLGYLHAYPTLTYLSPRSRPGMSFDEIVVEAATTSSQRGELAYDQLIDHQLSELYALRRRVRDEPDSLALVAPLVADILRAWYSSGRRSLIAGLQTVLGEHRRQTEIEAAVAHGQSDDTLGRSALLVLETIQRRTDSLGQAVMAEVVRVMMLRVIAFHQRMHIARLQFLRWSSNALYDPADTFEARAADATALFAACQQAIRADSIRYILEAKVTPSS